MRLSPKTSDNQDGTVRESEEIRNKRLQDETALLCFPDGALKGMQVMLSPRANEFHSEAF